MKLYWLTILMGALVLGGCNRGLETKEAVRQGVIDHLAERANLDVGSMQVEVSSVSFRENEADATVMFRTKGAAAGPGMAMNYTLEKKGNRWVVTNRREVGETPHGAVGGEVHGMPSGELPAGHPPIGAETPYGSEK